MWFEIDYKKLAVLLLPIALRKRKTIAFVHCLTQPIDTVYQDWKQKRADDWYKLAHNGQVCKMEGALNDEFDPVQRRIYIDDGDSFPQEYIFTEEENEEVFLDDTLFVFSEDEYENTGVDFVVFVPYELVDANIHKLNYLIKYYKLAGKRYRIEKL
ncbi:hypothetical protein [Flavobacterium oreochromis]|uniref:Uncharacterized protein n=1 Tax=Flavobacterium columnare TaxID=996 RepID=A0A246G9T0_9FLAO|nr:hypothetical protein [Flavobacterium oreochromis]OWP76524.1 hypothetical protein BWK62_09305 [Flavobacterium oreochromis]